MAEATGRAASGSTSGSETREARELGGSLVVYDIVDELERLRSEPKWQEGDRNTIALAKDGELRVLLSALREGAELHEEDPEGRIAVQVLEGRVQLDAGGSGAPLISGQVATVEAGARWSITAIEESVVLLMLAWPVQPATQPD